ncbi:MAG: hypothetical protein AB1916_02380 [Thermodesulfobacteriota bacterium]
MPPEFKNDDAKLLEGVDRVRAARKKAGLEGLVGGLEAVIVNVERGDEPAAVHQFLDWTGLGFDCAYSTPRRNVAVLKQEGCADFLVTSRRTAEANPHRRFSVRPKTEAKPDARLETFVFKCRDLMRYVAIQKARGVRFATEGLVDAGTYLFIQTPPSARTGNSLGFIQWREREGDWRGKDAAPLDWTFAKPDKPYLGKVFELDHAATRVMAQDRDAAILEFMELTGYDFSFSVYVESLNSITSVARLSMHDYAQVFTSGIEPFTSYAESGPTEKFIANYGRRAHHAAFRCEDIGEVFAGLKADGMQFLVELVGGPHDGLHQTFTQTFPATFLVHEYIQRYAGFDGFFTKSNVTELTRATDRQ